MGRFGSLVHGLHFNNIRGDILGGLTAAIVALPLALAFGVSSGAGATAGLYGAICVGLVAALFGGTPAQISGPTGPMTVVMVSIFTQFVANDPVSGVATAFTVVMLGGLMQVGFGFLRLGRYITLMPHTVISGFMTGIGVIIIILQIAPLLGVNPVAGITQNLLSLADYIRALNPQALILALLTLGIVIFTPPRLNRILPAPLIALLSITLISVVFMQDAALPRIGHIPQGLPSLVLPHIDWALATDMLKSALLLAALGSLDSLLTSLVADNISRSEHDSNRELIGQGLGNCLAGLFGGLPGAGATMRTVVNLKAGGQTPISGVTHALILLAIAVGAGSFTQTIPLAVLAGILMKVGIDIIDWGFIKRSFRVPFIDAALMYGVMLLTVFADLVSAVLVGIFVANLIAIKRLSEEQTKKIRSTFGSPHGHALNSTEKMLIKRIPEKVSLFDIHGAICYGAAKEVNRTFHRSHHFDCLVLNLSHVSYMDISAALAIESMIKEAIGHSSRVFFCGANEDLEKLYRDLNILDQVEQRQNFSSRQSALEYIDLHPKQTA